MNMMSAIPGDCPRCGAPGSGYGTVEHELRTPLAAIRMYAQTLQTGQLDQDPQRTAECLETIIRETRWLDGMVDSVGVQFTMRRDEIGG